MNELHEADLSSGLPPQALRLILEGLPLALSWASLRDGRILYMNRACRQLFQCETAMYATVDALIDGAYPLADDRARARALWAGLWSAEARDPLPIGSTLVHVRGRDGGLLSLAHRGILLPDAGVGVAVFEDVTERIAAEDLLRRHALEDPLTGLANRRALQAAFDGAPAAAVIMVDLDGFKRVNDTWGHDAGDDVLRLMGSRLRACVRAEDLVCRLGGDEFVVLLGPSITTAALAALCERILAAVGPPFTLSRVTVTLGLSLGVARVPDDGDDLAVLLAHADQALYRVKGAGKGGWAWFRPPA